jgi:hypothetical protein
VQQVAIFSKLRKIFADERQRYDDDQRESRGRGDTADADRCTTSVDLRESSYDSESDHATFESLVQSETGPSEEFRRRRFHGTMVSGTILPDCQGEKLGQLRYCTVRRCRLVRAAWSPTRSCPT